MLVLQTNIVGVQLSFFPINAGHFSAYALSTPFVHKHQIYFMEEHSIITLRKALKNLQ